MMRNLFLILAVAATPALAQQGNLGGHFLDNWDLNEDGTVTLAELQERRGDVFASFDSNEDGYLDAQEYTQFDEARAHDMKEHGGGHGGGHGKGQGKGQGKGRMMRAADGMKLKANDADGDGKVSQQEFLDGAASWFETLDRNGDGAITKADFGKKRG
jgi:hypothetical protein